jgi:hypothetical protein
VETEVIHAVIGQANAVQGPWQLAALALILAFIAMLFLMHRSSNKDTLARKYERDKEQASQNKEIADVKRTVEGLGHSFDKHINEEHSGIKATLKEHYDGINSKIEDLAKSMHKIELVVVATEERHKYEDMPSKRKRGAQ